MFGYGNGNVVTCVKSSALPVNCAPGGINKYITTYFRKSITVVNPAIFSNFTLNVYRDDGIVVYVNGVEVAKEVETSNPTTSAVNLYLGGAEGPTYLWQGKLDELKIYNYARTTSQIIEDMNGGYVIPLICI